MEEFNFTKSQLETLRNFVLFPNDFKYPIGTILVTDDETFNPVVEYGGGWAQIKDKFLLGAGDIYNAANGNLNGGSANAVCVNHVHNQVTLCISNGSSYNYRALSISQSQYNADTTSDIVGRTGSANIGEDGTGKNMPPYTAKYIWIKTTLEADS